MPDRCSQLFNHRWNFKTKKTNEILEESNLLLLLEEFLCFEKLASKLSLVFAQQFTCFTSVLQSSCLNGDNRLFERFSRYFRFQKSTKFLNIGSKWCLKGAILTYRFFEYASVDSKLFIFALFTVQSLTCEDWMNNDVTWKYMIDNSNARLCKTMMGTCLNLTFLNHVLTDNC